MPACAAAATPTRRRVRGEQSQRVPELRPGGVNAVTPPGWWRRLIRDLPPVTACRLASCWIQLDGYYRPEGRVGLRSADGPPGARWPEPGTDRRGTWPMPATAPGPGRDAGERLMPPELRQQLVAARSLTATQQNWPICVPPVIPPPSQEQKPDSRNCTCPDNERSFYPAPGLPGTCSQSRNRSPVAKAPGHRRLLHLALPLKCHSPEKRYSVVNSKNLHTLEPPYGIEP
jgi:hypothetical protein